MAAQLFDFGDDVGRFFGFDQGDECGLAGIEVLAELFQRIVGEPGVAQAPAHGGVGALRHIFTRHGAKRAGQAVHEPGDRPRHGTHGLADGTHTVLRLVVFNGAVDRFANDRNVA